MKKLIFVILAFFASLVQAQISSSFVAIDQNSIGVHNNIPENCFRMWNTGTAWEDLNTGNGTYAWYWFDNRLQNAKTLGVSCVLMTLSNTPQWASSGSNSGCSQGNTLYACSPPNDLNIDGTGTDQHWKDYVTAVVNRAEQKINGAPRVLYWEMWNEPGWSQHYNGSYAQMVTMTKDACAIIHNHNTGMKCLTPANEAQTTFHMKWWNGFSGAGGLNSTTNADYLAYHGYTTVYPIPPNCTGPVAVPELVSDHVTHLAALSSKPQWDTEGSWGPTDTQCFTNPDYQAAWVARSYLVHAGLATQKYFWYAYQGNTGALVDANFNVLKSGTAFIQMASWLAGATSTAPCSAVGTVWTCNFNVSGLLTRAVWDTSMTCDGNGNCTTSLYTEDPMWIHQRDLDGNTYFVPPCCVGISIGIKPILLENF